MDFTCTAQQSYQIEVDLKWTPTGSGPLYFYIAYASGDGRFSGKVFDQADISAGQKAIILRPSMFSQDNANNIHFIASGTPINDGTGYVKSGTYSIDLAWYISYPTIPYYNHIGDMTSPYYITLPLSGPPYTPPAQ